MLKAVLRDLSLPAVVAGFVAVLVGFTSSVVIVFQAAAAMPADPLCAPPLRNRIVITPDPELPEGVTVAASAWGYTLVARCVDAAAFGTFYKEHVGRATEQLCADGAYYADDDAGVVGDAIMSPPDAAKD